MAELTQAEQNIMEMTALLWNSFTSLPNQHPDDIPEFRETLHHLQRIILARPAIRSLAEK